MSQRYHYLNGAVLPAETASLYLNDLGILRGYAIFDYFRTYGRHPFRMEDYLARFERSAAALDLSLPISPAEIAEQVEELIFMKQWQPGASCGFRLLLTGGYSDNALQSLAPNLAILTEDFNPPPVSYYQEGIHVLLKDFQRDLPEIKSTNYLRALQWYKELPARQAQDLLYHHQGLLSECSRSNFFAVVEGKLITPKSGILYGITRKVALELAQDLMEVVEADLSLEDLARATEAFTTGTSKQVVPIVRIDDKPVGNGRPGPKTRQLMAAFDALVSPLQKKHTQ